MRSLKPMKNTDTHSAAQLGLMRFGIGVARRGWCEPCHILNTRPLAGFLPLLQRCRLAKT